MAAMKLLMLAMLVGVIAAANVFKMPIHKQMPTYEELVARRISGQVAPMK